MKRRINGVRTVVKHNLSEHQDRHADEETDDQCPDEARATMKGSQACTQSSEKRQCIDCQREQQPAEEAEAENAENDTDGHGGSPRHRSSTCAFHHHHGAFER